MAHSIHSKDIKSKLDRILAAQDREQIPETGDRADIGLVRNIACSYAVNENSIVVLSDLKMNSSHIFYGGLSELLGIKVNGDYEVTGSIWEDRVLKLIHPDDLSRKHINELQFYNFIKSLPPAKRKGYYVKHCIRMADSTGKYVPVIHRIYYFYDCGYRKIRFAMCLYSLNNESSGTEAYILDSLGYRRIPLGEFDNGNILTRRETEILDMINKGMSSREISDNLGISINTVSRHRQNILEKLQARNSLEACRTAKEMKIIDTDRDASHHSIVAD